MYIKISSRVYDGTNDEALWMIQSNSHLSVPDVGESITILGRIFYVISREWDADIRGLNCTIHVSSFREKNVETKKG